MTSTDPILYALKVVTQISSNNMIVIFINGYARSGKTHLIENSPYPSVSTSRVLDEVAARFAFPNHSEEDLIEVKEHFRKKTPGFLEGRSREFKIKIAEQVMIPVFGRKIFAGQAVEQAMTIGQTNPIVLFETIGGEEQLLIIKELEDKKIHYYSINIRHKDELSEGIDIRELTGRGKTYEQLYTDYWPSREKKRDIFFEQLCQGVLGYIQQSAGKTI